MAKDRIPSHEITPEHVFLNRRNFLRGGVIAAGAAATGLLYRRNNRVELADFDEPAIDGIVKPEHARERGFALDGEPTEARAFISYNNFWEFSTDKEPVIDLAKDFKTDDWKIEIGGLCDKPRTIDMNDLYKLGAPEERVYRFRCVETWSAIVPWAGIPLAKLIAAAEPTSAAKYVAFQTLYDPKRLPNQSDKSILDWPYVEGLRLDEAMNPLSLLAVGLYGKKLPPQDGAPVRLVVPWKYGFKNIKSIVKITFVAEQPPTTWNIANPPVYGFYANVNPNRADKQHPQDMEHRIGSALRFPTLMFNGYGDQVASMYRGMDLDHVYY